MFTQCYVLYMYIPAHHHHSSLRVGSWWLRKCWAINHTESINTKNLMLRVNHLPHMAPTMVVPNSDHGVSTKLFYWLCVIGALGNEVDIGLHTEVKHFLCSFSLTQSVVCDVFWLDNLYRQANTLHTAPKIIRVAEVVEGNSRVVLHVGVFQLELTCWPRVRNFWQYEPSPECFNWYVSLALHISFNSFLWSLLWWNCGQLSNLVYRVKKKNWILIDIAYWLLIYYACFWIMFNAQYCSRDLVMIYAIS